MFFSFYIQAFCLIVPPTYRAHGNFFNTKSHVLNHEVVAFRAKHPIIMHTGEKEICVETSGETWRRTELFYRYEKEVKKEF